MSGHSREDYEKGIASTRWARKLMLKCGLILVAGVLIPPEVLALGAVTCLTMAGFLHVMVILLNKVKPAAGSGSTFHAPADSVTHAAEERAKAWARISAADREAEARRDAIRQIMQARAKAIQDAEAARLRTAALERKLYGLKRTNGREINRGPIIDITPEKL